MLIAISVALVVLSWDVAATRRRRGQGQSLDEAAWLGAIASELRAGASVRSAIADAAVAGSHPAVERARRLARAGAPMGEVGDTVGELPENGRRLAAALQVVSRTGGRSAEIFDGLADRAVESAHRSRERRALTTQVRFSAAVVAALPLLSLLLGGVARIGRLLNGGPGGAALAAIGLGMQALGVMVVWRMAKT